ncbi:MAG: zinc ABC transporter substrate-binding protein [Roseovarius sp.]
MFRRLALALVPVLALVPALILPAAPGMAAPPRVVADIAPVQSLAAMVMAGAGEPALLLPPGASPHTHALRPSQARALAGAEIVFWIGEELTPWLAGPLHRLAPEARIVSLLAVPGTVIHPLRGGAVFGPDADDGTAQDHGHAHAHAPGGVDPHAWLDPDNARLWLDAMAEALAGADPERAALYRANAARAKAEIAAASARIAARLAPLGGARFVVFHDAWQYFERRFGLQALGAIRLGDATPPGPARLAALRAALAQEGVGCAFAEPQFDPGLIEAVSGGRALRVAVLDPLGAGLAPGPGLYPALLEAIAAAAAGCLGAG